ncbi:hypothetical protein [Candidatus Nitrospira bockiana]
MKLSVKTGVSFGFTSGIITTLGLMVGLHSSTRSTPAVVGGILTIAIADAFSDALGIHISEESRNLHTAAEIWESTIATFLAKFLVAITFILPIALLPLATAVAVSVLWGLVLLTAFSVYLANQQQIRPWKVVAEHVGIACLVVALTHYIGEWIGDIE